MENSEKLINSLSKRSEKVFLLFTLFFALGGTLGYLYFGSQIFFGLWIPFCIITLTTIHSLCQQLTKLQKKVEELERRLK